MNKIKKKKRKKFIRNNIISKNIFIQNYFKKKNKVSNLLSKNLKF